MQRPLFNSIEVHQDDALYTSGTNNVMTGVMDTGVITNLRERAVFDPAGSQFAPLSSFNTGLLFAGSIEAKVDVETADRIVPTTFRGPQQLDILEDAGESHYNRQTHPNAWNGSTAPWSDPERINKKLFGGFPNPDLYYMNLDAIPTRNLQNVTNEQLTAALKASAGDYDPEQWLQSVGKMLRTGEVPPGEMEPAVASDGKGINSDPKLLALIREEHEVDFARMKRHQVDTWDPKNDPRYGGGARAFEAEQEAYRAQQEGWFSQLGDSAGFSASYTNPAVYGV